MIKNQKQINLYMHITTLLLLNSLMKVDYDVFFESVHIGFTI